MRYYESEEGKKAFEEWKKRLLREDDPSLHQVYKSKSDRSKGEEPITQTARSMTFCQGVFLKAQTVLIVCAFSLLLSRNCDKINHTNRDL